MTSYSFNISEFAGQNVRLQLIDATINSFFFDVLLDNVKITGSTLVNGSFESDYTGWNVFSSNSASGTWGIGYGPGTTMVQTAGLPSGSVFPIGLTLNTFKATDASGNVSNASFTVTVEDNQLPTVIVQNRTILLNGLGNATITAADINNGSTDNCGIATIVLSKTAFDCTNVGANTVTLTVTDIHGNLSTATAVVTVGDNIAPIVFTQNRTIQLNATGNATITAAEINNGSTDNCSIASIALSKTSFDCTNVGANTVTLTVTDVNGNVSTATAIVTVEDNIAPIVIVQNRTIQLNATGNATITAADINNGSTDNCSIASIALSKTSFDCTNVGANTVTLTVTDVNGNVSTATAVVTVEDNTAPIVITRNRTIQLNATGNATITAADINNGSTDNCSIASIALSKTAFDCSNVGANTVTLTVTDVNGNVSTATAVVTVEDKIAPIVITQNLTIPLSGGTATITAAQLNNGSTDNCGIASMTIDKTSFDCGKIGNHTVTLIVTDIHGNVASKTATVTIVGELTSSSISSIPTSSTFTGGVSTNLYLGYGAQSTTLQVSNMVVGGNGTNPRFYTYSWTGSASSQLSSTTSASPVFTPTAGGYYTFNVLVTNKYGCTTSATISICVKDIREVDKKGKFTGKVFICHAPPGNPSNNNTLSISVNAVASHLSQHSEDRLGSCSDAPCAAPSNMMMSTNSTDGAATKEAKIELSLQNTELVAYPNPFSQNTTVSFKLPYTEDVAVLEMYDMRGVKIQSLFNGPANANQTYEVKFNGQEISAGSYTFRLITSKEVKIFKVVMNTN
jgi:PKD repeat protein